jgi:hypothetical protein
MTIDQAKRVLAALESEGVQYKLVGSMAMAIHGLVRATRDMDIFVDPSNENVARLKTALNKVFHDPDIEQITAADLQGEYPAIQYVPTTEETDLSIDILSRLGEAFDYVGIESEERVVDGIRVRVATPRMLIEMKKDTVRPQDKVDAAALAQKFGIKG